MRTLFFTALICVGAARAQTVDPDTEAAARHFRLGAKLYDEAQYDKAVAEFEAADRLRPSPQLRYNIARANDRLEHWAEAISDYERYLKSKPADAEEVHARVQLLRSRLAVMRPLSPPPPVAAKPAPTPTYKRWWPWTLLGVAVAAGVGVGVGVGLSSGGTIPPPSTTLGNQAFTFR